jgi:hypothetical protein
MERAQVQPKFREQRGKGARKLARISRWAAFPNFDKMAKIADQPAAFNAHFVRGWRVDISEFRNMSHKRGKIYTRVTSQRQGVPKPSVDFQKDRLIILREAKFDHGHAVPIESPQHG